LVIGNKPQNRLFYIDSLKILLSIFVVLHHCARAYGPWGFWYFKEPVSELSAWFIPFFATNAGFLMAFFFFLSAYFMPGSYDRKGPKEFMNDRIRRFLYPLLFFVLFIMPIQMFVHYSIARPYGSIGFGEYFIQIYLGFGDQPPNWAGPYWPDIQLGHIWFLEHLLLYGLGYRILRGCARQSQTPVTSNTKLNSVPSPLQIIGAILGIIIISFTIRIFSPLNDWQGLLYFIQIEIAHLPLYFFWVLVGVFAYRNNWVMNFPTKSGRAWFIIGLIGAIGIYFLHGFIPIDYNSISGGLTYPALLYCVWETITSFGLIIGIVVIFRDRLNNPSRFVGKLGPLTYLVYLVHVPIVLAVQIALGPLQMVVGWKFVIVALCAIPGSFAVSGVLRRIPYIRRNLS
jgi:peptidoglycan/LPS O-acetylase OafA/YrhL